MISRCRLFLSLLFFQFLCPPILIADSIDEVSRSYEKVVHSIRDWSGDIVHTQIKDGETVVAEGSFSWLAEYSLCHCRLKTPTVFHEIRSDGTAGETRPGFADQEALITSDSILSVSHHVPVRSVPGFTIPDSIESTPFHLGELEAFDPKSQLIPSGEFRPDYMFRGNMPSLVDWLSLAVTELKKPERKDASGVDSQGQFFISTSPRSKFLFEKRAGWLPVSSVTSATIMEWDWEEVNSVSIPTRLRVVDHGSKTEDIYEISNSRVNQGLTEGNFDRDNMGFKRGDYLADRIAQKLYVYNGTKFVGPGQLNLQNPRFLGSIWWLLLVGGVILIFVFRWRRKNVSEMD